MTVTVAMTVAFNLPEEKEEHELFLKEVNVKEWSVLQTSGATVYVKTNFFRIGRAKE